MPAKYRLSDFHRTAIFLPTSFAQPPPPPPPFAVAIGASPGYSAPAELCGDVAMRACCSSLETAVAGAAGGVFLPPPPRGVAEPGAARSASALASARATSGAPVLRRAGVGVDSVRPISVISDGIGEETPASGATSLRRITTGLSRILDMVDAATGSENGSSAAASAPFAAVVPSTSGARSSSPKRELRGSPLSPRVVPSRESTSAAVSAERLMDTSWTAMSESNNAASATSAVSCAAILARRQRPVSQKR